jgi:hypothetical protein
MYAAWRVALRAVAARRELAAVRTKADIGSTEKSSGKAQIAHVMRMTSTDHGAWSFIKDAYISYYLHP